MTTPSLKLEPPEVPENDPFCNDKLNRKPLAESLSTLLESFESQSIVLAVNAPWGFGKTTFIRMWSSKLRNDGWSVVDFNAWENDFSENAFASILAELSGSFKVDSDDAEMNNVIDKVKEVGTNVAKQLLFSTAKHFTYGMIDFKELVKAVTPNDEETTIDVVKQYSETKKTIEKFKTALAKLAERTRIKTGKPLVIFIDELDRCRPTYAIKMLEAVKHLFVVPNIAFVIAIDRDQLCNSFQAVYGDKLNAIEYLRRFIDQEFALPKPSKSEYLNALWNRFGMVELAQSQSTHEAISEFQTLHKTLSKLFECFESTLSLRAQEQLFTRLLIILRMIPRDHYIFAGALTFLLFSRETNHTSYTSFKNRELTPGELLINVLSKGDRVASDSFIISRSASWIEGSLLGLAGEDVFPDAIQAHIKRVNEGDKDESRYSSEVMDTYRHFVDRHEGALQRHLFCLVEKLRIEPN